MKPFLLFGGGLLLGWAICKYGLPSVSIFSKPVPKATAPETTVAPHGEAVNPMLQVFDASKNATVAPAPTQIILPGAGNSEFVSLENSHEFVN